MSEYGLTQGMRDTTRINPCAFNSCVWLIAACIDHEKAKDGEVG